MESGIGLGGGEHRKSSSSNDDARLGRPTTEETREIGLSRGGERTCRI
jgi:hypothetical protein